MIEDGRAFGATLALKHVLRLLERKGVFNRTELIDVLDDARDELRGINDSAFAPLEVANASKAIGLLYLP